MDRRLLLNIVIGHGAIVLQLLAGEDEPLLIGRDPFFILDLGFDVRDRVGRLYLEGDGLAGERLHEDLDFEGTARAVNAGAYGEWRVW